MTERDSNRAAETVALGAHQAPPAPPKKHSDSGWFALAVEITRAHARVLGAGGGCRVIVLDERRKT